MKQRVTGAARRLLLEFFSREEHAPSEGVDPLAESTLLQDDLWLDTLANAELGELLSERLGLQLEEEELEQMRSVGDLARAIREHLGDQAEEEEQQQQQGVERLFFDSEAWEPSEEEWQRCLAVLQEEERARVLRFLRRSDAKDSLAGRLMLKYMIHRQLGLPFSSIRLLRTPQGKPYLPESALLPNFNFNVSHQGRFVVGACEPCCIVGIDVMRVELRQNTTLNEWFHTMRNCYTAAEWGVINHHDHSDEQRLEAFYLHWCLKESYIKAIGIGLGMDLLSFEFRNVYPISPENTRITVLVHGKVQRNWSFRVYRLPHKHLAACATGPPAEAMKDYRDTFPLPASSPLWTEGKAEPEPTSVRQVFMEALMNVASEK